MEHKQPAAKDFREMELPVFKLFDRQWALVTAGGMARFNSCTVSWGGLGNIWGRDGKTMPVATGYIRPARYTSDFLAQNEQFTVSFFPREYQKALGYMGAHSGRDGDKAKAAGLTPVAMGQSVSYQQAELTFLCKKVYQHQFSRDDLAPEVRAYYAAAPKTYPDFRGGWQPHIVFVGEILAVEDRR